jgi:hypothetical protein
MVFGTRVRTSKSYIIGMFLCVLVINYHKLKQNIIPGHDISHLGTTVFLGKTKAAYVSVFAFWVRIPPG